MTPEQEQAEIRQARQERLAELKQRVESHLVEADEAPDTPVESELDLRLQKALEDLRTYQVELELQNEELLETQNAAEVARGRWQALFEFLPLPTIVCNADGVVQEANDAALQFLGANQLRPGHSALLNRRLNEADRQRLYQALKSTRGGEQSLVHDLLLDTLPPRLFDAHLIRLPQQFHLDGHIALILVDRSEQVLIERERRLFQAILDHTDTLIYAVNPEGEVLLANQALADAVGVGLKQVVGHHRESFMPLHDALQHRLNDEQVISRGVSQSFEESLFSTGPARKREFLSRKFPLQNERGEIYAVAGVSTDVTEQRQALQELRLSEAVFMSAAEAIFVTDAQGVILRVNPAFSRQSGFSADSVVGHRPNVLKSGRQSTLFYQTLWQELTDHGHWEGEITNRSASGRFYTVWTHIRAIRGVNGKANYYVAIQNDLTALRSAESDVRRLSHYDPLTGLPNRTQLLNELQRLIACGKNAENRFSILFVDLDHFKEVNDTLGHTAGDQMLKIIAQRLLHGVRQNDLVGRMGGDEFVILLPGADSEVSQHIANKLLENISHPLDLGLNAPYLPQASVGCAVFPDHGDTPDSLISHADEAMYAAKLGGRHRAVLYAASMSEDNARKLALHAELQQALVRNEFRLYWQPKLRLHDRGLVGAEALLRWHRPDGSIMTPGSFLPLAERTGLMPSIDEWVLAEVCRQLALWYASGLWQPPLRAAFNLHATSLRRKELAQLITSQLELADLPAACLELEITESALLDDPAFTAVQLDALRQLGLTIALDDFGTGYSSLSYLHQLPFNTVKIDQSFVAGMLEEHTKSVLVDTILDMAHRLEHCVVAEGIETAEQEAALRDRGCDIGQGYLYDQALNSAQFAQSYLSSHPVPAT